MKKFKQTKSKKKEKKCKIIGIYKEKLNKKMKNIG